MFSTEHEQVKETIANVACTPADVQAIEKVMIDSLKCTALLLEGVAREYQRRLALDADFKVLNEAK